MDKIDPVTLEIIQNRLTEIGYEGGATLTHTAASPIVVHSKDVGFNVADPAGRTLVYSVWMPRHGTTLRYMLESCRRDFPSPEIHPGDMFLTNNPYDGALHTFDVAVISPVHLDGKIIAWTGCATHHMDIGAASPGLFYEATDWWQEGIILPPMRIVEKGQLREDLFRMFLTNVRMPHYAGLDLKAQIAANHVARRKILELAARYGPETLIRAYEEMISFSEMKSRQRIRSLNPGTYSFEDFIDFDRTYRLHCTLTVDGDTLNFDFTGTEPQSPTFINSALACSVGNIHNIIICLLFPDIEINEGCFRPITIHIPEGTLLNCTPPAPCSGASVIGGKKAQSLALGTLSQAILNSPGRQRATASWSSGHLEVLLSGRGRSGKWFLTNVRETSMLGGGARAAKDGLDVSNIAGSTNTSVPNVEFTEERFPILYLSRRLGTDAEGAGKFRSGYGGEVVFRPHGVESLELRCFMIGSRIAAPGLNGGLPGATGKVIVKKGTQVRERLQKNSPEFADLNGETIVLEARNPSLKLTEDDVVSFRCMTGGGFGHPTERDPRLVRRDVLEGLISIERAEAVYRTSFSPGAPELNPEGFRESEATDSNPHS